MKNDAKTNQHQPTAGSGSAEQTGKSRDEQKRKDFMLDDNAKNDFANKINVDKNKVADMQDLGAGSGRDDLAGGENDGMINQNTNEPTEHL